MSLLRPDEPVWQPLAEVGTPVLNVAPAEYALEEPVLRRTWGDIGKGLVGGVGTAAGDLLESLGEVERTSSAPTEEMMARRGLAPRTPAQRAERVESLRAGATAARGWGEDVLEGRSPGAMQVAESEVTDFSGGPNSAMRYGIGAAIAHKAAPSLAYMAPSAAALLATGPVGATFAGLISATTEGTLSEGSLKGGLRDDIMAMPDEEFAKVANGRSREEFVNELFDELGNDQFWETFALSAAGVGAGKLGMDKLGRGTGLGNRFKRAGAGGVGEAAVEAPQSIGEAKREYEAAKKWFDSERQEPDYLEVGAQGALLGNALGFGAGMISKGDVDADIAAASKAHQTRGGAETAQGIEYTQSPLGPSLPAPGTAPGAPPGPPNIAPPEVGPNLPAPGTAPIAPPGPPNIAPPDIGPNLPLPGTTPGAAPGPRQFPPNATDPRVGPQLPRPGTVPGAPPGPPNTGRPDVGPTQTPHPLVEIGQRANEESAYSAGARPEGAIPTAAEQETAQGQHIDSLMRELETRMVHLQNQRRMLANQKADTTNVEAEMANTEAQLQRLSAARGQVQGIEDQAQTIGPNQRQLLEMAAQLGVEITPGTVKTGRDALAKRQAPTPAQATEAGAVDFVDLAERIVEVQAQQARRGLGQDRIPADQVLPGTLDQRQRPTPFQPRPGERPTTPEQRAALERSPTAWTIAEPDVGLDEGPEARAADARAREEAPDRPSIQQWVDVMERYLADPDINIPPERRARIQKKYNQYKQEMGGQAIPTPTIDEGQWAGEGTAVLTPADEKALMAYQPEDRANIAAGMKQQRREAGRVEPIVGRTPQGLDTRDKARLSKAALVKQQIADISKMATPSEQQAEAYKILKELEANQQEAAKLYADTKRAFDTALGDLREKREQAKTESEAPGAISKKPLPKKLKQLVMTKGTAKERAAMAQARQDRLAAQMLHREETEAYGIVKALYDDLTTDLKESRKEAKERVGRLQRRKRGIKVETPYESLRQTIKNVYNDVATLARMSVPQGALRGLLDPDSPVRVTSEFGDKVQQSLIRAMQAIAKRIDPKARPNERAAIDASIDAMRKASRSVSAADLNELSSVFSSAPEADLDKRGEYSAIQRRLMQAGVPARENAELAANVADALETEGLAPIGETPWELVSKSSAIGESVDEFNRDILAVQALNNALPIMENELGGSIGFFNKAFGFGIGFFNKAFGLAADKSMSLDKLVKAIDNLYTAEVSRKPVGIAAERQKWGALAARARRMTDRVIQPIEEKVRTARKVFTDNVVRIETARDRLNALKKPRTSPHALKGTVTKRSLMAEFRSGETQLIVRRVRNEIASIMRDAGFSEHADKFLKTKSKKVQNETLASFNNGLDGQEKLLKRGRIELEKTASEYRAKTGWKEKRARLRKGLAQRRREIQKEERRRFIIGDKLQEYLGPLVRASTRLADALEQRQRLPQIPEDADIASIRDSMSELMQRGIYRSNKEVVRARNDFTFQLDLVSEQAGMASRQAGKDIDSLIDDFLTRFTNTTDPAAVKELTTAVNERALTAFEAMVENEYVAAQPKARTGDDAWLSEEGSVREDATDDGGGRNKRRLQDEGEVFGPPTEPPGRSDLHTGVASIKAPDGKPLDKAQTLAVRAITEGLTTGEGFYLGDGQGFGKTIELLLGAINTLLKSKAIKDPKGRNRRIVILTPVKERFKEDIEKFGLAPLLSKHDIDIVVSKNFNSDFNTQEFENLEGEKFATMPELTDKGFEIFIYDESHKSANPFPDKVKSFGVLWDTLNNPQDGAAPKAIFSTGTLADKPAGVWPLAKVAGMQLDEFWKKLGLEFTSIKDGGTYKHKAVGGIVKFRDRVQQLRDMLADNFRAIRRTYNPEVIDQTKTKLDAAQLHQAHTDIAKALGKTVGQTRKLFQDLERGISQRAKMAKATTGTNLAGLAELQKAAIAARDVVKQLEAGQRPVVAFTTQKPLKFGTLGKDAGLPPTSAPKLFEQITKELLKSSTYQGEVKFGRLYGRADQHEGNAAQDFQDGTNQILVMTMEKGAEGIDLHNVPGPNGDPGDAQRVLTVVHLPDDYKKLRQTFFRVARRNQRSAPVLRMLHNEEMFKSDSQRMDILREKEKMLRSVSESSEVGSKVLLESQLPDELQDIYTLSTVPGEPGVSVLQFRMGRAGSKLSYERRNAVTNLFRDQGIQGLTASGNFIPSKNEVNRFLIVDRPGSTENVDYVKSRMATALEAAQYQAEASTAADIMTSAELDTKLIAPVSARLSEAIGQVEYTQTPRSFELDAVLERIGDGKEDLAELANMVRKLGLDVGVQFDADLDVPAQYDPDSRTIFVRKGVEDAQDLAYIMMHEAVHAATLHGLRADAQLRQQLQEIYEAALVQAGMDQLIPGGILAELRAGRQLSDAQKQNLADREMYGLLNVEEFVAEAYVPSRMTNLLDRTNVQGRDGFRGILRAVLEWFDRVLGTNTKRHLPVRNAISDLIDVRNELFQTEARAKGYWEAGGRGRPTNIELGKQASDLIDTLKPYKASLDKRIKIPNPFEKGKLRKAQIFYESRTDMLNRMRTYARDSIASATKYDSPHLKFLTNQFVRNKDQQVQASMRRLKQHEADIEGWADEFRANPSQMAEMHSLMLDSSLQGIYLDQEFDATANSHLKTYQVVDSKTGAATEKKFTLGQIAAARRNYDELRARWDRQNFSEKQRKIYRNAYQSTEKRWGEIMEETLANILRTQSPKLGEKKIRAMTEALKGQRSIPADWKVLDDSGEPLSNQKGDNAVNFRKRINAILAAGKTRGPYFPARRPGEFVVTAERVHTPYKTFATKAARDDAIREIKARDATVEIRRKSEGPAETRTYGFEAIERVVQMVENETEGNTLRRELDDRGFDTKGPMLKKDFTQQSAPLMGSDLDRALDGLKGQARQAALNFFLDYYPGTSLRHAMRHRKNVIGASTEMLQAYAQYIHATSYHLAQLEYGHKIGGTIKEMTQYIDDEHAAGGSDEYRSHLNDMQGIVNELRRRENDYLLAQENEWDVAGGINRLMFLHTLAQPGFILMNATQVPLATAPVLAGRFGIRDTTQAMGKALGAILPDFMRRFGGTAKALGKLKPEREFFEFLQANPDGTIGIGEELIENIRKSNIPDADQIILALENLAEMGRFDLTLSAVLHQAKNESGTTFSRKYNTLMELARGPVQVVETGNRVWAGMTAYMLYREQNAKAYTNREPGMLHHDAVAYAAQIIDETQVNYSEADAPRWMSRSGPLKQFAPLIFMYKRYSHYMTMNFVRNAKRAIFTKGLSEKEVKAARLTVAYLTATHVAAAGALGLPQHAKVLVGLIWGMLGGGEDDPRNFDEWARDGLQDLFGDLPAQVLSRGLPHLLNVDMSGNLGLDNAFMYTDDLRNKQGKDLMESFLVALGGPLMGTVSRLMEVPSFMERGQWDRAAEVVAPKVFRNLSHAFRLSEEGLTDRAGDVIRVARDASPAEVLMKAFGLSSANVSEFYSGRQAVSAAKEWYNQRRSALISRYRGGQRGASFRKALAEFNASVPTKNLRITEETLRGALERGEKKLKNRFGMNIPDSQEGLLQYGEFANF